jgi:hypothetical protein
LVRASHQQITQEWWEHRRKDFDVFISQIVLDEAAAGDPSAAAKRLAVIADRPLLDLSEDVFLLASALIQTLALPAKAATDAAHIANAEMATKIQDVCRQRGFKRPVICTPEELMGDWHHD